jgi:hypothetical protein
VQIVDAIRILGLTAWVPWVGAVDWGALARLGADADAGSSHGGAGYGPEVDGVEPAGPMTNLVAVREAHQEVLDRMVTPIRRRGYSVRTERGYLDWVLRFIAFHGGRSPTELAEADVAGGNRVLPFLEGKAEDPEV